MTGYKKFKLRFKNDRTWPQPTDACGFDPRKIEKILVKINVKVSPIRLLASRVFKKLLVGFMSKLFKKLLDPKLMVS